MQTTQKPFRIVSASAGSGKTYQLVSEYLKTLFQASSDDAFRHILAMTFTNKAAYEMKNRVIHSLEVLAYPEQYDPKDQKYLPFLLKNTHLNEQQIHQKSKQILGSILHRYEDFNLLTIDKFNAKLIRTFARDLNVEGEFRFEINQKQWLAKEVDKMIMQYGEPEQGALQKLLLQYALTKLSEGEKWDLHKNLKSEVEALGKERNLPFTDLLENTDFSSIQLQKVYQDREEVLSQMKVLTRKMKEIYEAFDAKDHKQFFGQKSRTDFWENFLHDPVLYGDLIKKQPNIFSNLLKKPEHAGFQQILQLHKDFEPLWQKLLYVELRLQNFFPFAFFKLMQKQLTKSKIEDRTILVNDFNRMLADLIGKSEAPFIYDRIGQRFQHLLLDEFQDTSRLQWINLIPLVHNMLSEGNSSFVVGDPKQSIYRFKNGVAEQFLALPSIYNPERDAGLALRSHYFEVMGNKEALTDNWRSAQSIVLFNNLFYEYLKSCPQLDIEKTFSDHQQNAISREMGYVEVQIGDKDGEEEWLLHTIREVLNDGFSPSDITILGRKKVECTKYAEILTKAGYQVVSADSLDLHSDLEVQLIISFFEYRMKPNEKQRLLKWVYQYSQLIPNGEALYFTWLDKHLNTDDQTAQIELNQILPHKIELGSFESLIQLFHQTCKMFGREPLKNSYLTQLGELIAGWEKSNGPDLYSFCQYYNETGKNMVVQFPKSESNIEILTIHKSKGLEFEVVLLPKMIIKLDLKPIWIEHEGSLFNTKDKKLDNHPISKTLEQEEKALLLDEVNTLYVATTRAVSRLYGLVSTSSGNKLKKEMTHFVNTHGEDDRLVMGERERKQAQSSEKHSANFYPELLSDRLWFPDIAIRTHDRVEFENLVEAVNYGNQLHETLSKISRAEDIEIKCMNALLEGKISKKNHPKIVEDCKHIFDQFLNKLLTGAENMLTEHSILIPELGKTVRPDLIIQKKKEWIVIDYKTGASQEGHRKQIDQYQRILRKISKDIPVHACLYYTDERKAVWSETPLL